MTARATHCDMMPGPWRQCCWMDLIGWNHFASDSHSEEASQNTPHHGICVMWDCWSACLITVHSQKCKHVFIDRLIHTCITCSWINTYIYTYIHTYTHTYAYTNILEHTYLSTHTLKDRIRGWYRHSALQARFLCDRHTQRPTPSMRWCKTCAMMSYLHVMAVHEVWLIEEPNPKHRHSCNHIIPHNT